MDEIISYKMCAVKVRNAKLRNYLKILISCQHAVTKDREMLSNSQTQSGPSKNLEQMSQCQRAVHGSDVIGCFSITKISETRLKLETRLNLETSTFNKIAYRFLKLS